ncbi:MAG: hypothetical protein ABIP35_05930 [Ginsengibacter sp.]
MMNKKSIITFFSAAFIFCAVSTTAFAQSDSSVSVTTSMSKDDAVKPNKNIFKTNLTGILLKNYSLQYERVLNRKISVAVQFRTMPSSTIPFQKLILSAVGDNDPDTKKIIEDFRLSNFAITPEVRLYLSKKGYGRGFYIAPFYRYASFTSNDLNIFYTDDSNVESSIKLSGKLTTNTGGILFGVQSFLGKHVVLDLWLLGPHFGSGTGEFNGTPSKPLTAQEQANLRQQLEDIDIPLTNKTVNVSANNASFKLDGPWGGIRSGISIGVKF